MSLLRKTLTLSLGEGAARVLGVIVFALLARALSLRDFGSFSFAMNLALMLGVVVDMGQNSHLVRLVAREPERGPSAIARVSLNKAVLGAATIVVVSLALFLTGFHPMDVQLTALMGIWGVLLSVLDSLRSIARARGFMQLDSQVNALESLGRLVVIFIVWVCHAGLLWYGIAFIFEALLAMVWFAWVLGKRVPLAIGAKALRDWTGVLKSSWALGISALAMAGFYRIDQVFVQRLAGAAQNGLYGAASRVAFTATVGGTLVMMAAYPELAHLAPDPVAYRSRLRKTILLCASVATAAAAVMLLGAPAIVRVLYGAEYQGAIKLVRILSGVVLANGLTVVGTYSANALAREKQGLLVASAMIVFNVIANLMFVPRYGALGAAWVSSFGEILLAVSMLMVSADRLFGKRMEGGMLRPC